MRLTLEITPLVWWVLPHLEKYGESGWRAYWLCLNLWCAK